PGRRGAGSQRIRPAAGSMKTTLVSINFRRTPMAKQSQTEQTLITRRNYLAATGAGLVAAGLGAPRRAAAAETIRQGYQTNIWGMPTYYLIKSGYLQKHGLAVEEFAVPSGNVTMQQMVARQVDLGTYAGPSFIIGNVKGGLIAIAVIETVGKTAHITNMVAALSAKTVDAMVNVEPYNVIAVNDGIGSDLVDFSSFDPMPVFMAATPDMVEKPPDVIVAYLKAWLDAANDFKNNAKKVNDTIYQFYASKGYKMSPETFSTALSRVEVKPGFPDMKSYMQQQADILLKNNTIKSVPDWSKALRPDFMEKAKA